MVSTHPHMMWKMEDLTSYKLLDDLDPHGFENQQV